MPEPKPTILSIETATAVCSVALIQSGEVIGSESLETWQRHNEVLPLIAEKLMARCAITYSQLSAVAVSIGPGSFTGLRVGLSFAKGIAVATGIGIIPVNTLDALALTMSQQMLNENSFLPMVIARRGEVFGGLYEKNEDDIMPHASGEVFLGGVEKLTGISNKRTCLGGAGCDAIDDSLTGTLPENMVMIKEIRASAESVGIIGYGKWLVNPDQYKNFRDLEPQYLKEFTVKITKR